MASDEIVEQPVETSSTETVTETPAEPEAEQVETAAEPRSKTIPRERFDEVYSKAKQEREARIAAERYARELEARLQAPQSPDPYAEDPFMAELRAQRQELAEVRSYIRETKEERERREFWEANADVPEEVQEEVESTISEFKSRGLNKINREDLLNWAEGKRKRAEAKSKPKTPAAVKSPTPPINRVAVVEGGQSAPKPSANKSPDDMTLAELTELLRKNNVTF